MVPYFGASFFNMFRLIINSLFSGVKITQLIRN